MTHKHSWRSVVLPALTIALGNILYALTVRLFLMPSGLIVGGATGIALAINRLFGLPTSGVLLVFNLIMLGLGWAVLGRAFALSTLASTFLSPIALALWEQVLGDLVLTDDLFLNTLFGGIGIGVSLGMVIRAGGSTGGMDIPPLVLRRLFRVPVSLSMSVFDLMILLAQAMFSPRLQVLYGISMIFVYTTVLDKTILLGTTRVEVKIVSAKADEIRAAILNQIDRGVTLLHGEGGYLHHPTEMILSVLSKRELPRLEKLVLAIDPECFMVVSQVSQVNGRGFSISREYQDP